MEAVSSGYKADYYNFDGFNEIVGERERPRDREIQKETLASKLGPNYVIIMTERDIEAETGR